MSDFLRKGNLILDFQILWGEGRGRRRRRRWRRRKNFLAASSPLSHHAQGFNIPFGQTPHSDKHITLICVSLTEPRKLSFNTTFSTQNIGLGFRVITFTPEKKHTGMFGAMPEAPSGIAPNTFPCFCCPGILFVYKTETATLPSQKIRMSLFGRKKPLRARSALAPCFFVFTTYRLCLCNV